eukprot:jgi/Bigna1/52358/estExt_Genewise1Plus.C_70139
MAQASWNGVIVAETKTFETIEGNIYFPPEALKKDYFRDSDHTSVCGWKGKCNYYNLNVDGKVNLNCAFVYKNPKPAATKIKDYVAFWKGVKVEEVDPNNIGKGGNEENKTKNLVQGEKQSKKCVIL